MKERAPSALFLSLFNDLLQRIVAPNEHDSVIVGLELNPVAKMGNRIVSFCSSCVLDILNQSFQLLLQVHLGVLGRLSGWSQ